MTRTFRSKVVTAAAGIVGAGLVAPTVLFATVAHADPVATVKARTQRMSDANLNSRQNGWYNPGDKVTLVCSKRGQAVKGFFSFNIPNGGWDNLWYKTSDNSFVADVDIETGTLKDVTDECGAEPAPAPAGTGAAAPASAKVDAALQRANSMVGTDAYGDIGCGRFVAAAFGVPGIGYDTALEFRNALDREGKINMNFDIPRGALVFSQSSWDKGAGHIDIAQGDGTFVSGGVYKGYSGLAGAGHNVQVMNHWNPAPHATFLGWAAAPW